MILAPQQPPQSSPLAAGMQVIWEPQPGPQTLLVTCPVFEIFFGGARGGGKTDGMLGDWLAHCSKWGQHAIGVFFRRELTQLDEVIARAKMLFEPLGAKYNDQKKTFIMPGGARLKFRHLDKDADAEKYQGHSYTRVYMEELTNFPDPTPVMKLMATVRSGVVPHSELGFRATGNPGGPGHLWVKARYIDPQPKGLKILRDSFENPFTQETVTLERVFIPSKLSDNRLMMTANPLYVAQLQQAGSASLVRAWLEGLWDTIDGAYFDTFDPAKHILDDSWVHTLARRPHLTRFRSFDWGYGKPFSIGWWAISDGTFGLPRGAMIRYREWYGCEPGRPNVGIRLDNPDIAEGILARERGERIEYGVADPAIFTRQGGPSIAEQMIIRGVSWIRADNSRIAGWTALRERLSGEKPLIYFLENCRDTIRTLPVLQHSKTKPEDLDTEAEDHAADDVRYAVMSRPRVAAIKHEQSNPFQVSKLTFNDLLAKAKAQRLAKESRNL